MSDEPEELVVEDILDMVMDDLEDLPSFDPFPPGAHQVRVSLEMKEVNKHQCVEANFTIVETLDLSDPNKYSPAKEGDTCSTLHDLSNKYAVGALKKLSVPLGEALGLATLREVIEEAKGIECVIITSLRKDKNDDTRFYLNINECSIVG